MNAATSRFNAYLSQSCFIIIPLLKPDCKLFSNFLLFFLRICCAVFRGRSFGNRCGSGSGNTAVFGLSVLCQKSSEQERKKKQNGKGHKL
jgi:hypothetical protein